MSGNRRTPETGHRLPFYRWVDVIGVNRSIFLALSLSATLLLAAPSFADWFQWKDGDGVVHLTDRLENVPESYREQALLLDIPATPPPPPPPPEPESVSIPLESVGQVAVVSALLNDSTPTTLIVDTGASYTVITYDVAGALRIDLNEDTPVTQLQTANGVITTPVVELESVDVGGMKLSRVKAAVHDFSPSPTVGGLLGLNFLKHFRVDIDTVTGTLQLQRRDQNFAQ